MTGHLVRGRDGRLAWMLLGEQPEALVLLPSGETEEVRYDPATGRHGEWTMVKHVVVTRT